MIFRWRTFFTLAFLSLTLLAMGKTASAASATPAASAQLKITGYHALDLAAGRFISFSPNGKWAAVQNGSKLCTAAVRDLTDQHCVTFSKSGPRGVDAPNLRWSPDGTKLAFSEDAFRLLIDGDIWVMEAATGKVTDLTPDTYKGSLSKLVFGGTPVPGTTVNVDTNPAWSADGKTIYFSRAPVTHGFQGTHLMRIPATGGTTEEIATIDLKEPGLSYIGGLFPAPDGKTIYFTIAHSEMKDRRNGVWQINVDGTGRRHLAGTQSPEQGFPILIALSPAGNAGLVEYTSAMTFSFAGTPFALMNMHSGTVAPLTPQGATGDALKRGRAFAAAFSPDGKQLVYGWSGAGNGHRQQLIVRDLPGGREQVISPEGFNPLPSMQWAPGLVWTAGGLILGATDPNTGFALEVGS